MSRCPWKGPICLSCAIWSGAIIEEKRVSTLNSVGISSRQDGKCQMLFFFLEVYFYSSISHSYRVFQRKRPL